MSIGCHELIRQGEAILVTTAEEVAETTGRIGTNLARQATKQEVRATDGLDERSLRVHEALDRNHPQQPEQIAILSGVPLDKVRAILPALELTNRAEHKETGWRRHPTVT
jgi:DNA processing protein